jgi:2-keto-4-pentenoate hydratase
MTSERTIDALHQAATSGRLEVADVDLPEGIDAGLAAQLDVLARFERDGDAAGGWKVGLTSGAARDAFGPGVRPFGYLRGSRILRSGAVLSLPSITSCRVEPELALVLGTELRGPDVDAARARAAVSELCPAFEVNEIRTPPGSPVSVLLADDLAQWGVVLGAGVEVPDRDLTRTTVEVRCDGELVRTVTPGDGMDDPFLSLARLANGLHRFGRTLHDGDVVITGAFSIHTIDDPGRWQASFTDVGDVEVVFSS